MLCLCTNVRMLCCNCVYVCMCVCVCVWMYVCMYIWYVCMYVCMYAFKYVCMLVYIYIYIYLFIIIYIYIQDCSARFASPTNLGMSTIGLFPIFVWSWDSLIASAVIVEWAMKLHELAACVVTHLWSWLCIWWLRVLLGLLLIDLGIVDDVALQSNTCVIVVRILVICLHGEFCVLSTRV